MKIKLLIPRLRDKVSNHNITLLNLVIKVN